MFIDSNHFRKGALLDAYMGYVAHLLSDEIFVITARQKLVKMLAKEGIGQRDRVFFERFAPEVHNNDLILSRSYPRINKIQENIESVKEFEIKDYVTHEELEHSRRWVINNFLENPRKPDNPIYITPKDVEDYINQSVEYVISYIY